MNSLASTSPAAIPHALAGWARRLAFVALLGLAVLVPHLSSDGFDFPAVSRLWSLLPFCGLFLLPLLDIRTPWRLLHLDLLALLSFLVALGAWSNMRSWPVLLIYPPLLYLCLRMVFLARIGRGEGDHPPAISPRLLIGRSWLVAGILVLVAVHLSWALESKLSSDVAQGGVKGALDIAHGRALYAKPPAGQSDPHTDTYGPVDYEAYLPFALLAGGRRAAQLTTLFFDLLTALALFALGRQVRGPTAGILLAYCWLAFPFSLYEEVFAFNDAILAATLVGAVLVARQPLRRGAMTAVAAWTKLSPLALLPLLAAHPRGRRSGRRELLEFVGAFALVTALVFIPALTHSDLTTFISRSFGFQAGRAASGSIWAQLQGPYAAGAPWIGTLSRIVHGLLVALTGVFAISLLRASRREDAVGLAACTAAVLIAIELCLGYYSFSYILWFAPLAIVAVVLAGPSPIPPRHAASAPPGGR